MVLIMMTRKELTNLGCMSLGNKQNYLNDLENKLTDKYLGKKAYWEIVNTLMNKRKILGISPLLVADKFFTNYKEKANLFNNYFLSQSKPIPNSSTLLMFLYITNVRLETLEINGESILTLTNQLNVNKTHGVDQISVQIIKCCVILFLYLFQLSSPTMLLWESSLVNRRWLKLHQFIRKENKPIIKNYWPISLLSNFAKIFERLLFQKMCNYFITDNLISKNQSGFPPHDSVTNQLISLVESTRSSFDINYEVRSVLLGMSKAFHKVWHDSLIFKLKQDGINGKLLDLFESYLSNRNQCVVINGSEYEWGM